MTRPPGDLRSPDFDGPADLPETPPTAGAGLTDSLPQQAVELVSIDELRLAQTRWVERQREQIEELARHRENVERELAVRKQSWEQLRARQESELAQQQAAMVDRQARSQKLLEEVGVITRTLAADRQRLALEKRELEALHELIDAKEQDVEAQREAIALERQKLEQELAEVERLRLDAKQARLEAGQQEPSSAGLTRSSGGVLAACRRRWLGLSPLHRWAVSLLLMAAGVGLPVAVVGSMLPETVAWSVGMQVRVSRPDVEAALASHVEAFVSRRFRQDLAAGRVPAEAGPASQPFDQTTLTALVALLDDLASRRSNGLAVPVSVRADVASSRVVVEVHGTVGQVFPQVERLQQLVRAYATWQQQAASDRWQQSLEQRGWQKKLGDLQLERDRLRLERVQLTEQLAGLDQQQSQLAAQRATDEQQRSDAKDQRERIDADLGNWLGKSPVFAPSPEAVEEAFAKDDTAANTRTQRVTFVQAYRRRLDLQMDQVRSALDDVNQRLVDMGNELAHATSRNIPPDLKLALERVADRHADWQLAYTRLTTRLARTRQLLAPAVSQVPASEDESDVFDIESVQASLTDSIRLYVDEAEQIRREHTQRIREMAQGGTQLSLRVQVSSNVQSRLEVLKRSQDELATQLTRLIPEAGLDPELQRFAQRARLHRDELETQRRTIQAKLEADNRQNFEQNRVAKLAEAQQALTAAFQQQEAAQLSLEALDEQTIQLAVERARAQERLELLDTIDKLLDQQVSVVAVLADTLAIQTGVAGDQINADTTPQLAELRTFQERLVWMALAGLLGANVCMAGLYLLGRKPQAMAALP